MWKRRQVQSNPVSAEITAEAAHLANGTVRMKFWVDGRAVKWLYSSHGRDYIPYHVHSLTDGYADPIFCEGNELETECHRRKRQIQKLLDEEAQRKRDHAVVRVEPC